VEKLKQEYVFVPRKVKEVYLVYLLREVLKDQTIIIFTGRCKYAAAFMRSRGLVGLR